MSSYKTHQRPHILTFPENKNPREMTMRTNEEILAEIHTIKNHSTNTRRRYKYAVDKYCKLNKMSLHELILEAEKEEDNGVRWKHTKLKQRLIKFRQYLLENYAKNTINSNFVPITVIYGYYEIEIRKLPEIAEASYNITPPISYADLPDKEVIRAAIKIASPLMAAIIYFIVSSGTARAETLSLTIQDYMNATKNYHNTTNITEMIDTLNQIGDVVPTFTIKRLKTSKYYTTFCSPEAVVAINHYLLSRPDPLSLDSQLFKVSEAQFIKNFQKINDELGLGKVGKYRRFRSHMLRKFHATTLYNDGLSLDKVNDLQGKTKNRTDSVYFMTNPEDLQLEYCGHLNSLTMSEEVTKITVKSKEFLELENKNRELQENVNNQQSQYNKLIERIEALENNNVTWDEAKKEY